MPDSIDPATVTISSPRPMPPPYPQVAYAAPAEYEFDMNQNEVIGGLGSSMGFVAIVQMIIGAIYGVAGTYVAAKLDTGQGIVAICNGVLTIAVAIWLLGASRSFKAVVATQGNDITNMMTALKKLRSVYKLYAVLFGILIAIFALAFFFALATAGSHAH